MGPKKLTFQNRTGEKEENLSLPLKITETIGSGFPNFVLGILLADSTITRSMALNGQKANFSNEVKKTRALELAAAPPGREGGGRLLQRRGKEERRWVGP